MIHGCPTLNSQHCLYEKEVLLLQLTKDNESAAVYEAVQAAPGMCIDGRVARDGPLLPAALIQVTAVHPAHVVVARAWEDPQGVLIDRRKVAAHHFWGVGPPAKHTSSSSRAGRPSITAAACVVGGIIVAQ